MMYYYGNMGSCWGSPWGILGGIINILLVVFFIFLIVRLFRRSGASNWRSWSSSAEDILKERYAKGEISKEEYEDRINTLRR